MAPASTSRRSQPAVGPVHGPGSGAGAVGAAAYDHREVNLQRLRAVATHAVGSILDVGCGNGTYVVRSPGFAVGVDLEVSGRWQTTAAPFVVAEASALPFADSAVDTVLSFETIEHLHDPSAALQEYRRVARRLGIFTVPNCALTVGQRQSNLIYHHWIDPTHRNFFDGTSFERLLDSTGWDVVEMSTINTIDLAPLVVEALRVPRFCRRFVSGAMRRYARRYDMTLLAVARLA